MKYIIQCVLILLLAACTGIREKLPPSVQNQTPFVFTAQPPPSTTPTLAVYDFPLWMRDPNTVILAALMRNDINETRGIYLFNAATGQHFQIHSPMGFSGFFWYDNMNFGLLSKDLQSAYKFNLQTGQMHVETVSAQSTRFLDRDWINALVIFDNPSSNEVIFHHSWGTNDSLMPRFGAQWNENYTILGITDLNTNEIIREVMLPDDRYGTELVWSPVNENELAILQGSLADDGNVTEDMSLSIMNVLSGDILFTSRGNFGILEWSPDGKKILSLDPSFRYRNYGVAFEDAPCILSLETGRKECLEKIPHIVPEGYDLATTGIYQWAQDSQSFFYTYLYYSQSGYEVLGDLCRYNLVDDQIHCMMQDLDVLQDRSIVSYDLSLDEQFIHFCYSSSTILNDYAGTSNDGMMKLDGSGFFSWTGTIQNDGPTLCAWGRIWRPLP
jgi:hypothetical protein